MGFIKFEKDLLQMVGEPLWPDKSSRLANGVDSRLAFQKWKHGLRAKFLESLLLIMSSAQKP